MTNRNLFFVSLLIVSSALLSLSARGSTELPAPPAGYAWKECRASNGALLLPTGWFFHEAAQGDTSACFASRESIAQGGQYWVGLSVHALRDIPGRKGLAPSHFVNQYLAVLEKSQDILRKQAGPQGPFFAARAETRSRDSLPEKILHTYTLLVANDKTGTVFLVIAEAPDREWSQVWPIMEPVLQKLLLDDAI